VFEDQDVAAVHDEEKVFSQGDSIRASAGRMAELGAS